MVFGLGVMAGRLTGPAVAEAQGARLFELRTYTAAPGKNGAMQARFRDHVLGLFRKHGMHAIGYWTLADAPLKDNTFIYVLAHESRQEASKAWQAFEQDPEWLEARAATETGGPLVSGVVSVFMTPTDYSPMK